MAIGIVGSNNGYSRSVADNRFLKLTGGTLTGSLSINNNTITSSQPLSLTQTWNNAAVTFAGLQANITDSASGNLSTLIDLRVGGTPLFRVFSKTGNVTTSGGVDTRNLWVTSNHINIHAFGGVRWTPTTDPFVTPDLILARDAANTLAQRNGANAQALRLYNTYTSSTSFERLNFRWDTNVAKIGTEKGSAGGVARDLVLETDGTERVRVSATGRVSAAGALSVDGNVAVNGTAVQSDVGLIAARAITDPATTQIGISGSRTINLTASNSQELRGGDFSVSLNSNAFNHTGIAAGIQAQFQNSNTATVSRGFGIDSYAYQVGTGTLTTGAAGRFSIRNLNAAGVITNAYGAIAQIDFNNGTITNTYGFYVGDLTSGTQTNTPYSFYASDSGSLNYFAGNVGIGTTSPAQKLDVVGSIRVSSGEAYKSAGDLYLDAANNASTYFRDGSTVNAVITNLGSVGIGTTTPSSKLDVGGTSGFNTTSYNFNVAEFIIQPYSAGNGFFANNAYFNGSSYTRINTGFAAGLQFYQGQIMMFGAESGSGAFAQSINLKSDYLGVVSIGGSISTTLGVYTGAALVALANGNVGIGNVSPQAKLDVNGTSIFGGLIEQRSGVTSQETRIYRTYTSATNYERLSTKYNGTAFSIGTEKGSAGGTARPLHIATDSTVRIAITAAGNVGIGELNPTDKLTVNGNMSATGSVSADFVSANSVYGTSVKAQNFVAYSDNVGVDGSFQSADGYAITVEGGIITAISVI